MKNSNWKKKLIAAGIGLASGVTIANAQEAGGLDLSAITDGLSGEVSGILTAGLAIGGAAVVLMAAPKGVRFVKKMWGAIAG
ncbi:hypothetical protein [Ruficoccus sp. ZRK36]|uniref:hypothetical protein n=1 Tax=Ruficoccus sp. ZRK36 TaxID=2866311 RepID=UPI001C739308|nr:hypothetical protein [Ruficoccus sp. ZRK36]QYY35161.1 hypothetical protein K0V07_12750 [Ruficoccus sp. ZRK36]